MKVIKAQRNAVLWPTWCSRTANMKLKDSQPFMNKIRPSPRYNSDDPPDPSI